MMWWAVWFFLVFASLCSSSALLVIDSHAQQADKTQGHPDEAFFSAARMGDVATVKKYLEGGLAASSRDAKGNTALVIAAGRGQTEVLNLLLNSGADPEESTSEGLFESKTALCWAASQGRTNAVAVLINAGADASKPMARGVFAGKTPLMWASSQGRTEVVKIILATGAEVDFAPDSGNFRGKNSLMWASSQGRVDTVAALLMHGSNVNAVDGDIISALMWASGSEAADDRHKKGLLEKATKGHIDVVQLLIKYGALADMQDKDGVTALMYASFNGHAGAVQVRLLLSFDLPCRLALPLLTPPSPIPHPCTQVLLNAGADPALQNNAGRTALQLSITSGFKDVSTVIIGGPNIQSLPLTSLVHVSSCGWLLSLLRAPVNNAAGSCFREECPSHSFATSCRALEKNGLNHNLGDLLYIAKESSIVEVVNHLGLETFASRVRATAQLKEMYRRFLHHVEDLTHVETSFLSTNEPN